MRRPDIDLSGEWAHPNVLNITPDGRRILARAGRGGTRSSEPNARSRCQTDAVGNRRQLPAARRASRSPPQERHAEDDVSAKHRHPLALTLALVRFRMTAMTGMRVSVEKARKPRGSGLPDLRAR